MFGGTFPPIDSTENALVFKCYRKSEFENIKAFENWVIKGYSIGQSPKWSNQHTVLLRKELDEFKSLGSAYKAQILRGTKIYDCCYIITQTDKAYIWIDFTATGSTYPKNYGKFKEIIGLFEKL